jgi:putative ABC transport system permease protein
VIRHLLKLVWKRKRSNALLTLEILFSFLVLFAVTTIAASVITRYRKPIGFDYHDVWVVSVSFPQAMTGSSTNLTPTGPDKQQLEHAAEAPYRTTLDRMLREARSMPPIELAAATGTPGYSTSTWTSNADFNGRHYDMTRDSVTDDYAKVMRLPLREGRWFGAEDDGTKIPPMVIDADLAHEISPGRSAVGQRFKFGAGDDYRIVGVIAPFRKSGEFSDDQVMMAFDRCVLSGYNGELPRSLVLRVRPGTAPDFEETLNRRLHAVAPDYPVQIRHMDSMKKSMTRMLLAPIIVAATVAGFLIFMVALGLSGVLWQNVTRRTREIGLRRALGASGLEVNRQILIEVALLSTLAVVVGVAIVAQLPILGAFHVVTPAAYGIGLVLALATVYAITLLCGLYPSWLAGRIQPAQALHYE